MQKKIKMGIIGLGRMGISHCAIANSHPNVNLVAVCEPSAFLSAAVSKHTDFSCYKKFEKMLDQEELDCAIITTPTKFHPGMVDQCLESGLHVFVEKPFCLSPDLSLPLVKKAEARKLINQVGYHNRFIGTFREVKKIVEQNILGEIKHIHGEAYGPVVLQAKDDTWRSNIEEGGGCLYDYATHVINLLQFVIGQSPQSVYGSTLKSIYSKNVDDAVFSTLVWGNNISGQISVNWSDATYRKMSTQITILFTEGKIICDAQELRIFFKDEPKIPGYDKGWNIKWVTDFPSSANYYLRGEEYSEQIDHFIDCILNNEMKNVNSFETAYQTDCVVQMIRTDHEGRK